MPLKRQFFTPEMGRQLKALRDKAGLSQQELAQRMGHLGKESRTLISRLESGHVHRPYLDTIVMFLRVCGARVSTFTEQFDRIEPVTVDTRPLDGTLLAVHEKQDIIRKTADEVHKYQRRIGHPLKGRPPEPARQQAWHGLADWRIGVKS